MAQQPFSSEELSRLVAALCDGAIDRQDFARLERLLDSDPEARQWYIAYLDLHGELCWNHLAAGKGDRSNLCEAPGGPFRQIGPVPFSASRGPRVSVPGELGSAESSGSRIQEPGESAASAAEPLMPPIVIDTGGPLPAPFSSLGSSLGGWLFSYAAATVITGMAILGAWVYKVSHDYHPAGSPSPMIAKGPSEPKPDYVGQITGVADCRWSNPDAAPPYPTAAIPLGHKYDLLSGLMEISYTTGAKVILQGPCSYEVDSAAGGFLALGKLTAKVEKSPFPLPPSTFVVRTPTAVVTDLGTEFGVEVDRSGGSRTRVFRGKVELRIAGGSADGRVIPLKENESIRVEAERSAVPTVVRHDPADAAGDNFVREFPRWTRMKMRLFNTGLGLREGDADPHWQIVAVSNDPKFKPQAAVVTLVNGPFHAVQWEPNDPTRSQWLSTAGDLPDLPHGVTWTFRTTFELPGLLPGSAVLRGRYMVDDYVKAIRLNGRLVPLPDEHNLLLRDYQVFTAEKGFVAGTNTIEIDVLNGEEGYTAAASPMLLRMEFDGTFAGRDDSAPPGGGKEVTK